VSASDAVSIVLADREETVFARLASSSTAPISTSSSSPLVFRFDVTAGGGCVWERDG